MKLIPFETVTYETKLTEKEVIDRLSGFIEPDDFFRFIVFSFEKPEKTYEGKINGNEFRMKRIASGGRKVIPIVIGEIENDFDKTIINISIRLTTLNQIILCLIYALAVLHSANLFFFFLIAYFFDIYDFNSESLRVKLDLVKLLDAKEV